MVQGELPLHVDTVPESQEALKGDILKGGHLQMGFRIESRIRLVDFALKVALDTSILIALSKAMPKGNGRLDRASAV